jgi:hypothetical protein
MTPRFHEPAASSRSDWRLGKGQQTRDRLRERREQRLLHAAEAQQQLRSRHEAALATESRGSLSGRFLHLKQAHD